MSRVEKEKEIISLMIKLYCRKVHASTAGPCEDCEKLLTYAHIRLSNCRYGSDKGYCGKCSTPCYKHDMKLKMKDVMRFSGPRLMIYQPLEFIRHLVK